MDGHSFVADGRRRAERALRAQQAQEWILKRRLIRVGVWRAYRAAIMGAGALRRLLLHLKMGREINRQLRAMERAFDREVADVASDYALFFTPWRPGR